MTEGKRKRVLKYFEALKELHRILKYTSHIKMTNFITAHKLNPSTAVVLKNGSIINEERQSHYRWVTIDPTLAMAIEVDSRLTAFNKEYAKKKTETKTSSREDIASSEDFEPIPIDFEPFPDEIDADFLKPFDPFKDQKSGGEKPPFDIPKPPPLQSNSVMPSKKEIEDMMDMLTKNIQEVQIPKLPLPKKTKFSLFWGLISYEKIK